MNSNVCRRWVYSNCIWLGRTLKQKHTSTQTVKYLWSNQKFSHFTLTLQQPQSQ
ncbi:hypothetical protein EXN66_Car021476 [Channa argus]|uniref:Uncharacterized protein n=1 Tax=Channa argus TaxID=215402 RepID=A0A6G1QTA9_CHAAH|nr:hypothetical protein EXN66_Car021476 [Channa argus]